MISNKNLESSKNYRNSTRFNTFNMEYSNFNIIPNSYKDCTQIDEIPYECKKLGFGYQNHSRYSTFIPLESKNSEISNRNQSCFSNFIPIESKNTGFSYNHNNRGCYTSKKSFPRSFS